jgi:branched-chain amino acid transport system ATP-binding protein
MMLRISNMTKIFGGLKAVDNVSIDIEKQSICSIIGPNGAGKTTLLNLITGIYEPTSGQVEFDGRMVEQLAPDHLAKLGMSRTFQNLQICMNMSALENVMLGAHLRLNSNPIAGMLHLPSVSAGDKKCREEALELIDFVGLEKFRHYNADQMSYGVLKRLEIARAMASRPRLMLLDEPAAGLNSSEKREIETLIVKMAEAGITIVLVEHDMKMVMNISDRIFVLDYGKKIAEGTSAEIRANPDVIAAYLGGEVV